MREDTISTGSYRKGIIGSLPEDNILSYFDKKKEITKNTKH